MSASMDEVRGAAKVCVELWAVKVNGEQDQNGNTYSKQPSKRTRH